VPRTVHPCAAAVTGPPTSPARRRHRPAALSAPTLSRRRDLHVVAAIRPE